MRYGSVCSGIEAATVAWHPLGWTPVFFSEIDKAAAHVLAHHYPHVPNHGDMTNFKDWPDHAIDVLVGGTPCQSFSIAGLRKGLSDPRGNLALVYLAIADRYNPKIVVWENVPGVLSSNGGRDFGAFLGGLAELGFGVCYRVLDAQFCRTRRHPRAVPQRRRRVFVVGCAGSDWRRAAAILSLIEGVQGHPPPRREAGQDVAPTIASRATGGGGLGTDFDCDGGLIASTGDISHCLNGGGMGRIDYKTETMIAHALRGEGHDASEDGTGGGTPIIAIQGAAMRENPSSGPDGIGVRQDGAAYTLEARQEVQAVAYRTAGDGAVYEEGDATAPLTTATDLNANILAFSCKDSGADAGEVAPTLRGMGHDESHANAGGQVAIAFAENQRNEIRRMEVSGALSSIRRGDAKNETLLANQWAVRRLTPKECERLQGFPDNYTDVPPRNKNHTPDGRRYKQLGNSMAVNVMEWIGERIQSVEAIDG